MTQPSINIRGIDIELERTGGFSEPFFKENLPKLYTVLKKEEINVLKDKDLCRRIFGFSYPLLILKKDIPEGEHRRYYTKFTINNYSVCNHWSKKSLEKWTDYLRTLV